jgi:3-deoxy-manno-octulosonate cytidylyltransferase (CMP-KDO synthetase)
VEQHGNNPRQNIFAVIPARLGSTRLENKLLLPLDGKPLVLHTVEQAKKARNIARVIVAADDERIAKVVEESENEVVLTSVSHQSGSDRIAEVAEKFPENSIIVNVQGDEPLISPLTIEKAVDAILNDETADIVTTSEKIESAEDVLNPNIVKVVSDAEGFALYFSRSPIPFPRAATVKYKTLEEALRQDSGLLAMFRKHTGLYVYRREYLLKYTKMPQTKLEQTEMLEQLRALENGARIKVVEAAEISIGVDTREDYERVKQTVEARKINYRKAKIEDVPAIAALHVESWQKSFVGIVPQEFLNEMSVEKRIQAFNQNFQENTSYQIFVAEHSERGIVGFADFGEPRVNKEFDAELYAVYFLPEFQRKGIGGNLIRLCQKQMIGNRMTSMFLETLAASPYKSFYEKLGGRIVGESMHKLANIEYKTLIYGWDDLQNDLTQ